MSGNGGRGDAGPIRLGLGLGRARGGAEEVRGEAREVGVRRIELRRRRLAGARLGGGLLVLCTAAARLELEEGEARDG